MGCDHLLQSFKRSKWIMTNDVYLLLKEERPPPRLTHDKNPETTKIQVLKTPFEKQGIFKQMQNI